jgi:hypothetical protein
MAFRELKEEPALAIESDHSARLRFVWDAFKKCGIIGVVTSAGQRFFTMVSGLRDRDERFDQFAGGSKIRTFPSKQRCKSDFLGWNAIAI